MKHKRCGVLILATALLIIGMRGACTVGYSQHVSFDKSGAQESNHRIIRHLVSERIHAGFAFRVKRYSYVAPKQFPRAPAPTEFGKFGKVQQEVIRRESRTRSNYPTGNS